MERTITLIGEVDEHHRLIVDVPDDVPAGRVEVSLRVPAEPPVASERELTRDEVRAKLRAAGLLFEGKVAPPDAVELSEEELETLAQRLTGPRPMLDYINEDREERI